MGKRISDMVSVCTRFLDEPVTLDKKGKMKTEMLEFCRTEAAGTGRKVTRHAFSETRIRNGMMLRLTVWSKEKGAET